jgi:hypothetical protein
MPMTPNIIQTMKQTVKARVLTISTDQACSLGGARQRRRTRAYSQTIVPKN